MSSQTILALVPDLLTSVRIDGAAQRMAYRLRVVDSDDQFVHELRNNPALAVIDLGYQWLDLYGVLEACQKARVPVLAFGPHADVGRQREARQAGANFVYPRSKFMADTTGCLRAALSAAHVS